MRTRRAFTSKPLVWHMKVTVTFWKSLAECSGSETQLQCEERGFALQCLSASLSLSLQIPLTYHWGDPKPTVVCVGVGGERETCERLNEYLVPTFLSSSLGVIVFRRCCYCCCLVDTQLHRAPFFSSFFRVGSGDIFLAVNHNKCDGGLPPYCNPKGQHSAASVSAEAFRVRGGTAFTWPQGPDPHLCSVCSLFHTEKRALWASPRPPAEPTPSTH